MLVQCSHAEEQEDTINERNEENDSHHERHTKLVNMHNALVKDHESFEAKLLKSQQKRKNLGSKNQQSKGGRKEERQN